MTEAFIGIGSNKGDRRGYIIRALSLLDETEGVELVKSSSMYECRAHVLDGADEQADYLNAVCVVRTSLTPAELLRVCLDIETRCGRTRSPETRWEARTLDLDILLYGNQSIKTGSLSIPHDRIAERKFVLVPLAEIRPNLHIPSPINARVQYLLENCPDTGALLLVVPRSSLLPDELD